MNVRLALRQLFRRPGFAAVALITLALGIGAPTAMFSVVHAVLIQPLPYSEADRIVRFRMEGQSPAGPISFDALPASEALTWATESKALSDLALFNDRALTISTANGPFRLTGVSATPNLFSILRASAEAGTAFTHADGKSRVVVLSHATWLRHLGGDRAAIGSLITMDGEQYRVLGVMPDSFRFPSPETAFWVPQVLEAGGTRGMVLPAVARLRDGATVEEAANEGKRLIDDGDRRLTMNLVVETLQDQMTGGVQRILWVLLGAVGFVAIIATTNLALLLITRGAGREREFSIRAALGAGRAELARQLFVEGLVLGAIGGIGGLVLASAALSLLVALAPADVPRLADASLDRSVLLFATALTAGSSLIFGLLSAGRTLAPRPWSALTGTRVEARLVGQSAPHRRRLNILAAAELSLTVVLLVAAGLLLRSFVTLVNLDPGFDSNGAVALQVNLPQSRYPGPEARVAFDRRLLDRLQAVPGVSHVGLATTMPTRQATGRFGFSSSPAIFENFDPMSMPVVDVHMVTEGFVEAMGLRLQSGRGFTADDRAGAEPVVILSEQFAKEQFPKGNAVGQMVYSGTGNRRVVGVVAEVRTAQLGAPPKPDAYLPLWQNFDVLGWFTTTTVIARGADRSALLNAMRPVVLELDAQSPPFNMRALDEDIAKVVAGPRFSAMVLGLFAAVAFAMAIIGVYGVMSYGAGLRTREVGIRLAVGATRAQVVLMMLKDGAMVAVAGIAVGAIGSLVLTKTLTGLLHEVAPADPLTIAGVSVLLAVAAIAAAFIPARRTTRIDPVKALRDERNLQPATGNRQPATGNWQPTGMSRCLVLMLVVGCRLQVD